jgi:hypothetical protein
MSKPTPKVKDNDIKHRAEINELETKKQYNKSAKQKASFLKK